LLRLCLDLNVFVADLLAEAAGRPRTAARRLVGAVAAGRCALGRVQLVVSLGMLDRLERVLVRVLAVDPETARERRELIAAFASLGPAGGPSLTLGGAGTMPMIDAEDAHVLDTALAGRADWLVTANLRDFAAPSRAQVKVHGVRDGLVVLSAATSRLLVLDPRLAAAWIGDPERHARDAAGL
jgi:PIN domain